MNQEKKKTCVGGPGKENLHGSACTLSRFRIEINPSTSGVGLADDMANIVLEVVTVDSQFRIPRYQSVPGYINGIGNAHASIILLYNIWRALSVRGYAQCPLCREIIAKSRQVVGNGQVDRTHAMGG